MICNFYQHSPDDIDETIVVESYEVNEREVPYFLQKAEDYMAFHFLSNNSCNSHQPQDVSLYKNGHVLQSRLTIHAYCEKCCRTHYENMHHVDFLGPKHFNLINNLFANPQRSNGRQHTPPLIYQWPLLVILFCFSKKNYHHVFV